MAKFWISQIPRFPEIAFSYYMIRGGIFRDVKQIRIVSVVRSEVGSPKSHKFGTNPQTCLAGSATTKIVREKEGMEAIDRTRRLHRGIASLASFGWLPVAACWAVYQRSEATIPEL